VKIWQVKGSLEDGLYWLSKSTSDENTRLLWKFWLSCKNFLSWNSASISVWQCLGGELPVVTAVYFLIYSVEVPCLAVTDHNGG